MKTNKFFRVTHRYLGFFLAGIMIVYALSGTILIFRETDFLKIERQIERKLEPNLTKNNLGPALRMREFKVENETDEVINFKKGSYNKQTGIVVYMSKELPFLVERMTHLHKATTKSPLYYLNIFFGVSLLFFSISSFWMFLPSNKIFIKGIYFTIGGLILTLIMLFFGD